MTTFDWGNDEQYDHCPHCGSDQHLLDQRPAVVAAGPVEEKKKFDVEAWYNEREEKTKINNDAIDFYNSVYDKYGNEFAKKAFTHYRLLNNYKVRYLFFDTETTGLPIDWKAPMKQLSNWPRVIQLAWILVDGRHNMELNSGKHLIYPDGWAVPDGKFWVDNGFNTMQSLAKGIPINDALDMFITDLQEADYLIAHNMSFDHNVLGSEMIRASKKGKQVVKICTKELSTPVLKLPPNYRGGDYKWPSLAELHHYLFNENFEDAHDAMGDVQALRRCFFELNKRGEVVKYLSTRVNNFQQ